METKAKPLQMMSWFSWLWQMRWGHIFAWAPIFYMGRIFLLNRLEKGNLTTITLYVWSFKPVQCSACCFSWRCFSAPRPRCILPCCHVAFYPDLYKLTFLVSGTHSKITLKWVNEFRSAQNFREWVSGFPWVSERFSTRNSLAHFDWN